MNIESTNAYFGSRVESQKSTDTILPIDNKTQFSRLHFFKKLVQTLLLRPMTTSVVVIYRGIKLLAWVPVRAGIYKVSGYHTESSEFFEGEYLKTVKAVRDLLFIPSVLVRVSKDMIATPQKFNDDIEQKKIEDYLSVNYNKAFQQFTSYLHGSKTFDVICPEGITQFAAASDGALQTIMASHLFKPNMMAINFGTPNVATFMTESEENGSVQTIKVDAKSLYREPMSFHATNGKMQSGVFLVPKNLPEEALERFKKAAMSMEKRKDITCVNTNCRVLQEAGFSIEGVVMDEVIFPNTLMDHLLFRNVFYTDTNGVKQKVHFDIINTTKKNLDDFFEGVDTAVVGTRLRHRRRNADTEENQKIRGAAAQALIAQEKERLAAAESDLKLDHSDSEQRKITISVPSFIGEAISRVWNRHTIYEVDLSDKKEQISEAFHRLSKQNKEEGNIKLRPFPQEKPNISTRLKRDFFFSNPVVWFLRRHIMGRVDTIYLHTQDIFKHLQSTKGARLNYVLLDDKIVLARVHANGSVDEIHKKAADWALSKHALLSGRQDVYCSGEMWYDETKDRFMINNDSGTYKPSHEHVQTVAKLANEIFARPGFKNVFEAVNEEVA